MYASHFGAEVVAVGELMQPSAPVAPPVPPVRISQPTTTELIGWIMLDRQIRLLAQRMKAE